MIGSALALFVVYLALLVALGLPLGRAMAGVYSGRTGWLARVLGPVERSIYRLAGIDASREMSWSTYTLCLLAFNLVGCALLYALLRCQHLMPLNPNGLGPLSPGLAFNTAISFATNTNWQSYGGEITMSHLSQMLGLTVQNFVSAAVGMAALAALIRGISRSESGTVGNAWSDIVRSTLYVLLPLSIVLALALVGQGVVQTLAGSVDSAPLDAAGGAAQTIPLGPVASQIAIKQLGTNGGGYFNVNSAHPFENSSPLSNFLQCFSILLLPAALVFMLGEMVKDRKHAWSLLGAMLLMLVAGLAVCWASERGGNPALTKLGVDSVPSALQSGGNMEGKEARFGVAASTLWAATTTAASNGSVNSMHDSYMPLGGLVPMVLMQLGEVVFGGVGSGLYGMILFVVIAVFLGGLLVGRSPQYLGKRIEAREMRFAVIGILTPSIAVLVGTAIACVTAPGLAGLLNRQPPAHGFSEILYALSSAANNNGSAFAGLSANTDFYNTLLGLAMFVGRFAPMIMALALAGALARKAHRPTTSGTLPAHGPMFIVLVIGTIIGAGALTFLPALALGPLAEQLALAAG